MEFKSYQIPDDLLYTKEHEWAKKVGSVMRVGITDYAAKTLNEIVYVELPKIEALVVQLVKMGTVESIKAVSELYSPLSGTVTGVNTELAMHPELVTKSPYDEGWLVEIEALDLSSEKKKLLNAEAYAAHLAELFKKQAHH